MTDETTPQDGKAMPPASDGSVLCVWGWVQIDWDGTEFVIPCRDQLEATHRARLAGKAVQFFPQPALTDEEREAVDYFAVIHAVGGEPLCNHAATLRGLLERLG